MKKMEKTGREKTDQLQSKMKEEGIDFLILSQSKSFEHLIFTRIPFICIIKSSNEPEVFTHYDSVDLVREQSWIENVEGIYPYSTAVIAKNSAEKNYISETAEYIKSFDQVNKKIGMDFSNTPVCIYNFFKNNLPGFQIVDFSEHLNRIYGMHTSEEVDMIKRAAEIAELGIMRSKELLENSSSDINENELASYAEYHMRKSGVEAFFVRSSVASGSRTCFMGTTESQKIIKPNDIVNVDYSPIYAGYFADICRPLSKMPFSKEIKEKAIVIKEALDIAISNIKPGVAANLVDRKVKEHFKKHGYDGEFIHHTGHPVGNSWGIMITSNSTSIIEEGMVFALEPGLYNKKIGGIRIEDNVYVSNKGAVNMMNLSRILI